MARAVRALAARRRMEAVEGGQYRLLDARPLEPGEPESVPRAPRKRKARRRSQARSDAPAGDRRATYADLGRAVVERVIDLGREAGEAIAVNEHLRREAKENRGLRIEAEQRAGKLQERVRELEHKLEMAEGNLRTVLSAARGRGATAGPTDTEMEALLRILKTPGDGEEAGGTDTSSVEQAAGAMAPAEPGPAEPAPAGTSPAESPAE